MNDKITLTINIDMLITGVDAFGFYLVLDGEDDKSMRVFS